MGLGINDRKEGFFIIPTSGWVDRNRQLKNDGTDTYGIRSPFKRRLRLSEARVSRLNNLQRSANAAGFLVALACPVDGEVVKTRRTGDLDDGVLAECGKCGKLWLSAG